MELLKSRLNHIIEVKNRMLNDTDSGLINYALLSDEIDGAKTLFEYLHTTEPHAKKLEAIKTLKFETTSSTIHKALSEYLNVWDTRYYFISYIHTTQDDLIFGNAALDFHPMDWQMQVNKSHPGQYTLSSWQEITKEEYDKFDGNR